VQCKLVAAASWKVTSAYQTTYEPEALTASEIVFSYPKC